ncbi:MAG: YciI family protein [Kiloniellaceae bacterium]
MYFVIHCSDKPNAAKLRTENLHFHVDYLNTQLDKLIWAGARQEDDGKTLYGSFFIVSVPDRKAAEAFSEGDPFTKAGLFERVEISNVRRGIFNPELAAEPT